jgi:4-hydroxy-3-methylbut-2-enyl diphosphate reductase
LKILVAKSAGFCFGVNKAVEAVNRLLDEGRGVCTLGPVIHNPHMVEKLKARGVRVIDEPSEAPEGSVVVVRSHGVPKSVYQKIKKAGVELCDATCPFVAKIHRIVSRESQDGSVVIIAGNEGHPEVVGIRGHCGGRSFVISGPDDIMELYEKGVISPSERVVLVSQTTFNTAIWQKCVDITKKLYTNVVIFDTICSATAKMQSEAVSIAKKSDIMVIIGGRESSNTEKLRNVCSEHCPTILIERADELEPSMYKGVKTVGITAGASTPADIIKEVLSTMSEIINTNEKEFDEAQFPADTAPDPEDNAAESPEQSAEQSPEQAAEQSAEQVAEQSPEQAAEQSPEQVAEQSPEQAAEQSPEQAAEQSPEQAAEQSPEQSTEQSGELDDEQADEQSDEQSLEQSGDGAAERSFEEMSFEEALEASLQNLNSDERVRGVVVGIAPNEVQVEVVGRKQTGYIPLSELSADPEANPEDIVKIGDELELLVLRTNDQEGTIVLSKRRVDAVKEWHKIVEAEKTGEILEGVITNVVKGGVIAVTNGIRIFIPASHASSTRMEDLTPLLNQKVRFKIIETNRARRRAVGSVRVVAREERRQKEEAFWAVAAVGQQYTGVVKSLTSYGAFVDLGGVDGMIHVSELSWSRVKHPSEVVDVGDTVNVYIRELDRERKRISLGYKNPDDNPWEKLRADFPVGSVCKAKIVGLTSFGAFAQILPGIDGLIHISQIADRRIEKPQDELELGQEVTVKILNIDFEKKRASLSIRALLEESAKARKDAEEEAADADTGADTQLKTDEDKAEPIAAEPEVAEPEDAGAEQPAPEAAEPAKAEETESKAAETEETAESEETEPAEPETPKPEELEAPQPAEPETSVHAEPEKTEPAEPKAPETAEPDKPEVAEPAESEAALPAESSVEEQSETEVEEPAETGVTKPAETEVTEPAKPEAPEPAEPEISGPEVSEVLQPDVSEIANTADSQVSQPAVSGISEPAKSEVSNPAGAAEELSPEQPQEEDTPAQE